MEIKEMKPAGAIRKYFQEGADCYGMPYPKISLQEIKEFKKEDPEGYEEIGKLCIQHYASESA